MQVCMMEWKRIEAKKCKTIMITTMKNIERREKGSTNLNMIIRLDLRIGVWIDRTQRSKTYVSDVCRM